MNTIESFFCVVSESDWALTADQSSSAVDQHQTSCLKASSNDPDTLRYHEILNQPDVDQWIIAAEKEIKGLESKNCWDEVPTADAKDPIIPGVWVFRRKRTPDGNVKKLKARFCVRGDLQDSNNETFAPVVAFSTVRIFLAMTSLLNWDAISIDFVNAFVQAPLSSPVYIRPPP